MYVISSDVSVKSQVIGSIVINITTETTTTTTTTITSQQLEKEPDATPQQNVS